MAGERAKQQGQQRAGHQHAAQAQDIVHIAAVDAVVDDLAHQIRDQHFHNDLKADEQW